ncbi:hypothetical protein ACH4FX_38250 [Streptomyces sp. NPDC018019]|uniref:hypothetical protein n=1 Tax=Streptomyces sp. NPDC018019 TaxID=3365030 RepID=UPI003795ACD9
MSGKIMFVFDNRAAVTQTLEAVPSGKRRRQRAWWGAGAALAALTVGVVLWISHPWADGSAFTATITGVTEHAYAEPIGDHQCRPSLAGESVMIYDAAGKEVLGRGVNASVGEWLPGSHGELGGGCFSTTRIEGVRGGEDKYRVQVGGGNMVEHTEKDLRTSAQQQREALKALKAPLD